jgi:diguanylate cyclase (GGDEF)-like protein
VRAALAVMGNWTFSPASLSNLADAVCLNLTRRHPRPTLESAARIDQLLYRMTRQVARAQTMEAVADAVLRHAAAAVHARMGALAVKNPSADDTAIVATFGYSRKLVEHVRIEPGAGIIGGVMRSRRPLRTDHRDRPQNRRLRYRTNSFVVVPVLSGSDAIGAVCVTDHVEDEDFTAEDVSVLRRFAATAALAIERQRAVVSAERYAHAAAVDPITGAFNRRHLRIRLDEELQRSRRHNIPVAVLVLDIDDFKSINDSYGHLVGDLVLKDVAEILRRSVRVFDICARFGGDEFVIVMPGSASAGASRIAERIRERIATYAPGDRRLARLRLTASIGLAMSFAESSAADVLERADQALYTAKHQGKNRVSTVEQA